MHKITIANLDNWELMQLQNFLNIKAEDFKLLIQAYRRRNTIEGIKPYTSKVLGRGMHSEFKKCRFFKTERPQQKVENWYSLTESGIELLKIIEEYLIYPIQTKDKEKFNSILSKF